MLQRYRFSLRVLCLAVGVPLSTLALLGCDAIQSTDLPAEQVALGEDGPGAEEGTPEPPASLRVPAEDVDTLAQSTASGLMESERRLIQSVEAWEEAWAQVSGLVQPTPAVPEVNFSTHQVVLVAMGERPSGGHAIGVAAIEQRQDTLFVSVVETSPGPDCMTTAAMTQPVMAVSMPAVDAPVVFVDQRVTQSCS